MMNRTGYRSTRRGQGGQALLEFGLSASISLPMVLGIMNLAYGVFCYHTLSSAAREAVRYAVVHGPASAAPATSAQIQQIAVKAAVGMNLTASNVTVSWPSDLQLSTKKDAKVTITFPYALLMTPITVNFTSTSQMMVSQ